MFPRWQCAPLRLWCPAQWLVRSCFNPYVFFSILAVRRGDMWRGSFMKARFVHRVVVFEMSSSWRPEWNKEQKEHSHIGEEKERKRVGVGGGGMHDRLCGWGESWELLNGLCEIYSNFFKYRPASSPPTLSTKGSDSGAPFTSTQGERGHARLLGKRQMMIVDDVLGEFSIPFRERSLSLCLGFIIGQVPNDDQKMFKIKHKIYNAVDVVY